MRASCQRLRRGDTPSGLLPEGMQDMSDSLELDRVDDLERVAVVMRDDLQDACAPASKSGRFQYPYVADGHRVRWGRWRGRKCEPEQCPPSTRPPRSRTRMTCDAGRCRFKRHASPRCDGHTVARTPMPSAGRDEAVEWLKREFPESGTFRTTDWVTQGGRLDADQEQRIFLVGVATTAAN